MGSTGTYNMNILVDGRPYCGPFVVLTSLTSPIILGIHAARAIGLDFSATDDKFVWRSKPSAVSAVNSDTVAEVKVANKMSIPPRCSRRVQLRVTMNDQVVPNSEIIASVNNVDIATQTNDVGIFSVLISNPSQEPITYPRSMRLGYAESFDQFELATEEQNQVDTIASLSHMKPNSSSRPSVPPPPLPAHPPDHIRRKLEPLIAAATGHLEAGTRQRVQTHLWRRWRTISADKFDLGLTDVYKHKINLTDSTPVYHKQFPIPMEHKSVIMEHVEKWLQMGVVEPAVSNYNSPIFCVKKKGDGGFRLCLDYRGVNQLSLPENYTIRTPDDCMAQVGQAGGKFFIALDLSSGFYQMELEKESRPITAFTVPRYGQLQWTRGAMGLKGCPGSFSRLMDMVLEGIDNTIVYIDDVLIYGKTQAEALHYLDQVLDRLDLHNLKINVAKSSFLRVETSYLGHVLSIDGISPGKEKALAISEAQPPHSVKQLKSFLGLVNYFRAYVKNFARRAGRLFKLTRADSTWKGGPLPAEDLQTFNDLKKAIAQTTPRAFPFNVGKFHLFVDGASGDSKEEGGLGAHLMQEDSQGKLHTIAFASRQLIKHEKNYTAFLLELQAAVYAIDYFSFYLQGRTFTLYTDHAPLTALSKVHTKTLHRLHALLNTYSFDVQHIAGKKNPVADFLSRSHGPISSVSICSVDTEPDTLRSLQLADPVLGPILKALQAGQRPSYPASMAKMGRHIGVTKNILTIQIPPRQGFFNDCLNRAILPHSLQGEVLQEAHNSSLGGHQGIFRTLERIKGQFWWANMDASVRDHLQHCLPCQATSNKSAPPPHAHDQYPGVKGPNQRIHVDLFGPVRDKERKKRYILGMTDSFTKILRLAVLPDKKATTTANGIWKDWMAIYGVPKVIVSDQGKEFVNDLQSAIYKVLDIKQATTSAYWPVCNQQQEHQNKTLQHYLRCVIYAARKRSTDWEHFLPALMLSVNTAVNKATKQAPFLTMFGYPARLPLWSEMDILNDQDFSLPPDTKDELFAWQATRRAAHQAAFSNAAKYKEDNLTQDPSKDQVFKHGDLVWVRRHVLNDENKKFGLKWEPAIIMDRQGEHVYKIRKLTKSKKKIHVVNSHHLKPRFDQAEDAAPPQATDGTDDSDGEDEDLGLSDDEDEEGGEENDVPDFIRDDGAHEDSEEEDERLVPPPRRSSRSRKLPRRYADSDDVDALTYEWNKKQYSLEEYMGTRPDMSLQQITEMLQRANTDRNPDFLPTAVLPGPPQPPPVGGVPPPPPLLPPGGGGGGVQPPPPPPHLGQAVHIQHLPWIPPFPAVRIVRPQQPPPPPPGPPGPGMRAARPPFMPPPPPPPHFPPPPPQAMDMSTPPPALFHRQDAARQQIRLRPARLPPPRAGPRQPLPLIREEEVQMEYPGQFQPPAQLQLPPLRPAAPPALALQPAPLAPQFIPLAPPPLPQSPFSPSRPHHHLPLAPQPVPTARQRLQFPVDHFPQPVRRLPPQEAPPVQVRPAPATPQLQQLQAASASSPHWSLQSWAGPSPQVGRGKRALHAFLPWKRSERTPPVSRPELLRTARSNVRVNLFPDLPPQQQPEMILQRPAPAAPAPPPPPQPAPPPQKESAPAAEPPAAAQARSHPPPVSRPVFKRHLPKPKKGEVSPEGRPAEKRPPAPDAHLPGPLYHVPVEPPPEDGQTMVHILPPPRLQFPHNYPEPTTAAESEFLQGRARTYSHLRDTARQDFLTQAGRATPVEAHHHDRGVTWTRYHAFVFDVMNPAPEVVYNNLLWGAAMPAQFHPTLPTPCSLRWGIIGHNLLPHVASSADLATYIKNLRP